MPHISVIVIVPLFGTQGVDVEPCNHGAGAHEAHVDARGSAPENARGWLLIEHSGPWAAKPLDTEGIPAFAYAAAALGIRLQLIRRPGKLVTGRPGDEPGAYGM